MIRKYSVEPSTSIGGPSYSGSYDFKVKESSSSFSVTVLWTLGGELGDGFLSSIFFQDQIQSILKDCR